MGLVHLSISITGTDASVSSKAPYPLKSLGGPGGWTGGGVGRGLMTRQSLIVVTPRHGHIG